MWPFANLHWTFVFVFRGIYRISKQTNETTGVKLIGEEVFARITDLKYIERIGEMHLFDKSNFY